MKSYRTAFPIAFLSLCARRTGFARPTIWVVVASAATGGCVTGVSLGATDADTRDASSRDDAGGTVDGSSQVDAPKTICSGTAVDEETDPKNCGGCGVVCDGTCALGRCIVTLVSEQPSPRAIAVDTTSIYWADQPAQGGAVVQMPIGGGALTTLASASGATLEAFAVQGSSIYWANNAADNTFILEASIGGGAATTLASEPTFIPVGLAVNATHVVWTTEGTEGTAAGTVVTVPLAGGTATTLAANQGGLIALAVDATSVYWKDDQSVLKAPLAGGAISTLCTLSSSTAGASFNMAVDATNVYWTGRNGTAGTLMKVPVGGGTATTLATSSSMFSAMAIDATSVYVASADILSVPISGGAATTLVAGYGANGLAVDATSVYWTYVAGVDAGTLPVESEPGSVMKVTPK